ncbi:MAG: putative Fe-S protein [Haloquadratum sp. J07HQX50]|nr:MAG: putative Fe-S protein [Haloquadratum sp. J07HQX50]
MRDGICRGCGRTLTEIEDWTEYTQDEKQAIMQQLPERLTDPQTD